jgi:hypothetical protein
MSAATTKVIVVGVAGTWAWKSAWWQDDSPFWRYMHSFDILPARIGGLAYRWSTDLGDSYNPFKSRRSQWEAGGDALAYYYDAIPKHERVAIAHSHGGQCVAYCAALGVEIDRLITVGTPCRADMRTVWARARPHIRQWTHVLDSDSDRVAWWGAFGDRKFGNQRHFEAADANVKIAGIGHSGLLSDPEQFHWWQGAGLIDRIKGV